MKTMTKVFCVGANKTGTTSIEKLFKLLGLAVAPQEPAERMLEDWARRDFTKLVEFCAAFEAFQDIPFSLPFTFQALDQAFPHSKFVLTVRSSTDEWYESLIRYETAFMELDHLPSARDLKENPYLSPGWFWRSHQLIWGIDEQTLYAPATYKRQYERHNESIVDYFSQRPADLLVLNVADPDAVDRVCDFLSMDRVSVRMPHMNRTR
jgi:hypothetical protein